MLFTSVPLSRFRGYVSYGQVVLNKGAGFLFPPDFFLMYFLRRYHLFRGLSNVPWGDLPLFKCSGSTIYPFGGNGPRLFFRFPSYLYRAQLKGGWFPYHVASHPNLYGNHGVFRLLWNRGTSSCGVSVCSPFGTLFVLQATRGLPRVRRMSSYSNTQSTQVTLTISKSVTRTRYTSRSDALLTSTVLLSVSVTPNAYFTVSTTYTTVFSTVVPYFASSAFKDTEYSTNIA